MAGNLFRRIHSSNASSASSSSSTSSSMTVSTTSIRSSTNGKTNQHHHHNHHHQHRSQPAAVNNSSSQQQPPPDTRVSKTVMEMMSTISPVTPYLSVSGCLPVCTQALLNDDYTAAICCTNGFEYDFPKDRIEYMHVRVDDNRETDLRPYIGAVCQMIEKHRLRRRAPGAHGRTLVFCAQGVSRSVSFVLAYLMAFAKMSLSEAYDLVRQRRRLACPNIGFFKQLIDLERQIYGEPTVRMIRPVDGFEVADVVWKYGDDMLKAFQDM